MGGPRNREVRSVHRTPSPGYAPTAMRRTPRTPVAAIVLAGLAACLFVRPAAADGAPEGLCDIRVDTRMSVYMVMVGETVFQDKRYLTWDDAMLLRDVLVSSGTCDTVAPPRKCDVKLVAAGNYAVMRDGVDFDRHANLRTLEAAQAYAKKLVKFKLCLPVAG